MPHGDLSDIVGFAILGFGLASIFKPEVWTIGAGPVGPMIDGALDSNTTMVISMAGSLMVMLGILFYVVRWNRINGPVANAPACIIVAVNLIYIPYKMDDGFNLRMWHVLAGVFLLGAFHMVFNANPVYTSAMLKEKEEAKAREAAAKTK